MLPLPYLKAALPLAVAIAALPPAAATGMPNLNQRPAAQHQAATPWGLPPVLRAPQASERAALIRVENQEAQADSYRPPSGASYDTAGLNGYTRMAATAADCRTDCCNSQQRPRLT